ncbi:MAG: WYL domain-containing protein [Sandaracinaceae bacterium]|nr:MAG: WYL domain-containing protein [Sandaracinaceae bacterium]
MDPSRIMTKDAEKKARRPVARAMRLLNELLETGGTLSVAEAADIMGVQVGRARPVVETVLEEFVPATRGSSSKLSIRLAGVRRADPSPEVTIAACFGAALADLFDGTSLQTGMRRALSYVTGASANPAKFGDLDRKFIFVRRGGEQALPSKGGLLERIAKAVVDQRPLRVTYARFEGTPLRKETIEPWSIAIHDHQVYVIAKRRGDDSVRTYRFSRFRDVRRAGDRFEYPDLNEFNPRSLFRDSFGVFLGREGEGPVDVVVRLSAQWKHYATCHRWHESQSLNQLDDGVEVSFHVRVCDELKMWIQGFGPDAEVVEPEWLRTELGERALALATRYRPAIESEGTADAG